MNKAQHYDVWLGHDGEIEKSKDGDYVKAEDYAVLRRALVTEQLKNRALRRKYGEHVRLLYEVKYASDNYILALRDPFVSDVLLICRAQNLGAARSALADLDAKRTAGFMRHLESVKAGGK